MNYFPVTIFGSSWRMLSKCHLRFLHICPILSSSVTSSSKSFICTFKATDSPLNMIYSLAETHQHSRAAAQSTHIPSPSKHTGMTATQPFLTQAPVHSPNSTNTDLGVCVHAWMSTELWNQYFLCIYESLEHPWHPSATKTQGAVFRLIPKLLNEA